MSDGADAAANAGGITLPIMLNNLIATHGFSQAVQYTGCLLLGCIALANALMHPRAIETSPRPRPSMSSLFDKTFTFTAAASFFVVWGLFFPIYYLQVCTQLDLQHI